MIIQIEVNTRCNFRCWFCQNAYYEPLPNQVMQLGMFEQILSRLKEYYTAKLPLVSFAAYNEPTLDPHFIDRVRLLNKMGFRYWWLSNGSLMTHELVDFLITEKPDTTDLILNLCSCDQAELSKAVGIGEQSAKRSLDLLADAIPRLVQAGKKTVINVHGNNDAEHAFRHQAMREWAIPLGASVIKTGVMDRAGMLPGVGASVTYPENAWLVCGAQYLSNHYIGVDGALYHCCHDYYKETSYGNILFDDLNSLRQSLSYKEKLKILKDTFCSRCEFAIDVKKRPLDALEVCSRTLRRKVPWPIRKKLLNIIQVRT